MEQLVPVRLPNGGKLFVRAESVGAASGSDDEREIASRLPSLDQVVASVSQFADSIGQGLKRAAPNRFTVEFECEMAVEAGALVAVLGKASGKAAFHVTMEWETGNGPPGAE
ncbi:CU044_2847 family protein [Nocardia gipuzkoensis]